MELFDLKRPKKTVKEMEKAETASWREEERYPWGSRIEFDKEEVEKIPMLQSIKADQQVVIQAEGFVKLVETADVSEKSSRKSRKRVEIQIEKIGIAPKTVKKTEDMSNEEYRDWRKGK